MTEDSQEFPPTSVKVEPSKKWLKIFVGTVLAIVFVILAFGTYIVNLNEPTPFTAPIEVTIEEGDSVPMITEKLEREGVVQSSELLYMILIAFYDPTKIKASVYVFAEPLTTMEVAKKLINGDFATNLTKITVFEGESREKIAARLAPKFTWFNDEEFLSLSDDLEGQLFPDTYFIPEKFTTSEFVELLHQTYQEVISEYQSTLTQTPLSEQETITLASIVEREANTVESMRVVAGIFLNRLDIGMPLQADASIEYVLEHEIGELKPGQLAESLREVDSPYNTYLYAGLPPTPIGNPGRDAIEAVLNPSMTDYMYYITGNDGKFYYASTYDEHLINIDRYLK